MSKMLPHKCAYCKDYIVLGEKAQSIVFESGFTIPVVHVFKCAYALQRAVETGIEIEVTWRGKK